MSPIIEIDVNFLWRDTERHLFENSVATNVIKHDSDEGVKNVTEKPKVPWAKTTTQTKIWGLKEKIHIIYLEPIQGWGARLYAGLSLLKV